MLSSRLPVGAVASALRTGSAQQTFLRTIARPALASTLPTLAHQTRLQSGWNPSQGGPPGGLSGPGSLFPMDGPMFRRERLPANTIIRYVRVFTSTNLNSD